MIAVAIGKIQAVYFLLTDAAEHDAQKRETAITNDMTTPPTGTRRFANPDFQSSLHLVTGSVGRQRWGWQGNNRSEGCQRPEQPRS